MMGPIRKSEPVSIVKTEPVGDVDRRLILPRFLPAGLFETVFFPVSFPKGFLNQFPSLSLSLFPSRRAFQNRFLPGFLPCLVRGSGVRLAWSGLVRFPF